MRVNQGRGAVSQKFYPKITTRFKWIVLHADLHLCYVIRSFGNYSLLHSYIKLLGVCQQVSAVMLESNGWVCYNAKNEDHDSFQMDCLACRSSPLLRYQKFWQLQSGATLLNVRRFQGLIKLLGKGGRSDG